MSDFTNQPFPPPPPQGSPPPGPPPFPQQSPPQYPQYPQYPQQPQYGVYQPQGVYPFAAAPGRTSGLAIASMVLGIVWIYWIGSILAVIFGHIALGQAKKDPTLRGKGMAVAGLVLGYVGIGVLVVTILAAAASSA